MVLHFALLCTIVHLKGFRGVFWWNGVKVSARLVHKGAQSRKVRKVGVSLAYQRLERDLRKVRKVWGL